MNRHFRDARYHFGRAFENAARGLRAEFEPVEERLRALTGREMEPQLGRRERARMRLRELRAKAESEGREFTLDAKRRFRLYRRG